MTADNCPTVSAAESMGSADSSSTKQRKRRKWDQPAESLVSAGVVQPGIFPVVNMGSIVSLPGVAPVSGGASVITTLSASCATVPQMLQIPSLQQHAVALVQKLNQPKIQDESIAREIVINDAEPAVRYKLTKRQTQEEIQKCTGAVVITRGKYRPPNAPPDGEKPLYLHISAGTHLETTVERIKAVDQAAAMVEEMLKQGFTSNGVKVSPPLSTCVFLGFDADPSFNIVARIRGPNDRYINHIMNETGATVFLKGRGSVNFESAPGEEVQQPLHLFLSCNNPKGLEQAKLLAENLLDTISAECGASRISSSKVYGAVPPPQQLLAGVRSSGNELQANAPPTSGLTSSIVCSVPVPAVSSSTVAGTATVFSQGTPLQSTGLLNSGQSKQNTVCHSHPSVTGGTSYNGYCGIYPQATPLQQVALALRQSNSLATSSVASVTTAASTSSNLTTSPSFERERRPQKRKFQELPDASKRTAKPHQYSAQESERSRLHEQTLDLGVRNISTMPAPQKLIRTSLDGMPLPPPPPPPPPRTLPPPPARAIHPSPAKPSPAKPMPPPPPKFNSSTPLPKVKENWLLDKLKTETVPDTLVKLMEYGDEDDDLEETTEETLRSNTAVLASPKPFWAV